jgi:hypothetical protein
MHVDVAIPVFLLACAVISMVIAHKVQKPYLRKIWWDMAEWKEGTPAWRKNMLLLPVTAIAGCLMSIAVLWR